MDKVRINRLSWSYFKVILRIKTDQFEISREHIFVVCHCRIEVQYVCRIQKLRRKLSDISRSFPDFLRDILIIFWIPIADNSTVRRIASALPRIFRIRVDKISALGCCILRAPVESFFLNRANTLSETIYLIFARWDSISHWGTFENLEKSSFFMILCICNEGVVSQ